MLLLVINQNRIVLAAFAKTICSSGAEMCQKCLLNSSELHTNKLSWVSPLFLIIFNLCNLAEYCRCFFSLNQWLDTDKIHKSTAKWLNATTLLISLNWVIFQNYHQWQHIPTMCMIALIIVCKIYQQKRGNQFPTSALSFTRNRSNMMSV